MINEFSNSQRLDYTEISLASKDATELFVRHYQPGSGLEPSEPHVHPPASQELEGLTQTSWRAPASNTDRLPHAPAESRLQPPGESGGHWSSQATRHLVIIHGASEHGGRYDHVARSFVDRGWHVIVGDQRGHGRSGGTPTHVRDFRRYLQDIDSIWQHFDLPPSRTALLGHSFGGLVSIRYAQTRPSMLSALVLMAPLLRLKVVIDPFTLISGKVLSYVAPRFRFKSRVDVSATTRNQRVLAQRVEDPLIHRSVTAGWYFQMKTAMRLAWQAAPRLDLPVAIFQGALDCVVDPVAAQPWLELLPTRDKQLHLLPEHLHELHNEPDWPQTIALVADWLEQRIACPLSVASSSCGQASQ